MVASPGARQKARRCVLEQLQTPGQVVRVTVKQRITVVEAIRYERLYLSLGSCFRECTSDRSQLTKLVIARPTERSDVIRHRQSAVDHDTKVAYAVNDTDRR